MILARRRSEPRQDEGGQKVPGTGDRRQFDRRQLLKLGAIAAVAGLFPHPLVAVAGRMILPSREISLFNTHTGEKLSVEYCTEGEYCGEALHEINHILRDFRTGEIKPIDPGLLNLLHAISKKINPGSPIHIISGYRSPATNLALTKKSGNVAKHSLHMEGRAIDIRIPGSDLRTLKKVALAMQAGGVGYYAKSNFVHLDTGRIRSW